MELNVTVHIAPDEPFNLNADDVALRCLEAIGGNPETDQCIAFVQQAAEQGQAGITSEKTLPPPES
jgi:hypothetical protein